MLLLGLLMMAVAAMGRLHSIIVQAGTFTVMHLMRVVA